MDSSTSPFKARFPRRTVALLFVIVAAWSLCILFSLKLNPYIRLYVQASRIQDRWADQMTREYGAKILVFGGSSCAFSIDGERMLRRFSLPTVNYGRSASFGATVLTESVLEHLRPGDTLIVAEEPQLLCESLAPLPDGIQFSCAMHHPEWVTHPVLDVQPASWFQVVTALRPGGYPTFTYLGKIATGKPLLRYHLTDYHASGWQQTAVRIKVTGPAYHFPHLSESGCKLLRNLRAWCDQHDVRVAYSLPWSYCPPDRLREFQKSNIDILLKINEFMPVLKDPCLGANTNIDLFADTVWHLTEPGSALRSDSLASSIKNWDTWTTAELHACDSQP